MFLVKDLGLAEYSRAYEIQKKVLLEVINGASDTLILCEHSPVFTLGRLAAEKNFLFDREDIKKKGAQIVRIDRGGEVTFHGPGQLVVYPILNLGHWRKDLKWYMEQLEQVAIDLLGYFDILADRIAGRRGVWVGQKKIASIGVGVKKWVSFHGMAININTDLSYFSMVKPCGLDVSMTSLAELKKQAIDMAQVKKEAVLLFERQFDLVFVKR